MTLKEMIQEFGQIPKEARMSDGTLLELMVRKRMGDKGYIATLWTVVGDKFSDMIEHGEGPTIEDAKEDLKNKILSER